MKKSLFSALFLLGACTAIAQVGMNTPSPASTLDVTAKNATGTSTSVDGLLIPRVDRERALSMMGVPTSTLIYVNSIATGSQIGTAVNIDATGYYYYNGTTWTKLSTPSGTANIYTADGTLTGARIVDMGANNLTFKGTSNFAVDSAPGFRPTFVVNGTTHRVGLGTPVPSSKLDIRTATNDYGLTIADDAGSLGLRSYVGSGRSNGNKISGWFGTFSDHNFDLMAGNESKITITPASRVGINTPNPLGTLHVDAANNNTKDAATPTAAQATDDFILLNNGNLGLGKTDPATNLDIAARAATGTSSEVEGIRIPAVDRQRAFSMTGVPTSTLIYINSIATGTQTGTAVNIDATGYYYYNGTAWVKLHNPDNTNESNIYTTNGTLAGNRTVAMGANTLSFSGTNRFSVDGATFVVDQPNDRIGIGTPVPQTKLDVRIPINNPVLQLGDNAASIGIRAYLGNNSGNFTNGNKSSAWFGTYTNHNLDFMINGSSVATLSTAGRLGINTANPVGTLHVDAANNNTDDAALPTGAQAVDDFVILGSGDIGVGTTTPQKKLHVDGSLQVTNELNVGGNAATVGSAGTTGQVLTSSGPNAAPAWTTPAAVSNIYTNDGTLASNRTVTQGTNTLAFTGTSANAFSVDGTTLSVDAAANRIGIGTTAPSNALHINSSANPIRMEGVQLSNNQADAHLVIDATGVVKTALTTAPALIVEANGGTNVTASGGGIPNNTFFPIALTEISDAGNQYNPVTGTFTAAADGLYFISTNFLFSANGGAFDGNGGKLWGAYRLNGSTTANFTSFTTVLKGTSVAGGINYYGANTSITLYLKAGNTIEVGCFMFGVANMVDDPALLMTQNNVSNKPSFVKIYRLQ